MVGLDTEVVTEMAHGAISELPKPAAQLAIGGRAQRFRLVAMYASLDVQLGVCLAFRCICPMISMMS